VGWIDADDVKVPGWEEEIMNRKDAPEGAKQHTMAELKPCPFCGNSVYVDYSYFYRDYVIYCNDCDMIFSLDDCNASEEKVCEAWNRRNDDDTDTAEWIDKEVRGSMTNVCSACGSCSVYPDKYCGGCGRSMKNGY
jgi:Lar family restriction alleviation protein